MNRRLRKKRETGEFTPIGFTIALSFLPDAEARWYDGQPEAYDFWDGLIDAVEARGLFIVGGTPYYVWKPRRARRWGRTGRWYTATPTTIDDRLALCDWLDGQSELRVFDVSPLGTLDDRGNFIPGPGTIYSGPAPTGARRD